jgi:hypothetical protein
MSAPSNGITAEVIREIMPPYQLSDDLLQATFAALAPPPRDASTAWRHARIRRLTQEISTLMPANATQARLAADILMVREMAKTIAARVHAPELTVPEMCRVGRVAGELVRTAGVLVRTLERSQQKPAPFFGTVLADAVDVAALDAAWGNGSPGLVGDGPAQQPATPGVATEVDPVGPATGDAAEDAACAEEVPTAGTAIAGMAGMIAGSSAPEQGRPTMTGGEIIDLDPMEQSAMQRSAADIGLGAGSTPEGVVTRLDQGPGWVLDVVRPRVSAQAAVGVAPAAS